MLRLAFAALLVLAGCDDFRGGRAVGTEMLIYSPDDDATAGIIPRSGGDFDVAITAIGTRVRWLSSGHVVPPGDEKLDRVQVMEGEHRGKVVYFQPKRLRPAK